MDVYKRISYNETKESKKQLRNMIQYFETKEGTQELKESKNNNYTIEYILDYFNCIIYIDEKSFKIYEIILH